MSIISKSMTDYIDTDIIAIYIAVEINRYPILSLNNDLELFNNPVEDHNRLS
jgi:hypothetical protein